MPLRRDGPVPAAPLRSATGRPTFTVHSPAGLDAALRPPPGGMGEFMTKRYGFVLLAALTLLAAPLAFAAEDIKVDDAVPGSPGTPGPQRGPNCDLLGYKSEVQNFVPPSAIPDNSAAGATYGPITVPNDGTKFLDVVVGLNVTHTWLGDLKAIVIYDENCDGTATPNVADTLLCRAGSTNCSTTAVGCSSNLVAANTYNFSNEATVVLNPTTCTSSVNLAGGCFQPSGAIDRKLTNFNGHNKGGCFYLFLSDNASLDTGTISSWQVHTLNERPAATESVTWTSLKSRYN